MPSYVIVVFTAFFLALAILLVVILLQLAKLKKAQFEDNQSVLVDWLKDMKGSLDRNTDVLDSKMAEQKSSLSEELRSYRSSIENQTKNISDRLETAAKIVTDVQHNLGVITDFGKDIKDLSGVLKSPKLRGGLGETFLKQILEAYLPKDLFALQYRFKDGTICDAVIFVQEGIIPIDSKFPAENFQRMIMADDISRESIRKEFTRDVKKRIDEIASKYIKPSERTISQAIMYIPSEPIYYEIITNSSEVEEYAKQKGVFMVSPNTIVYMLKVLLVAYKSYEIQKNTGAVLKMLLGLKTEAVKFNDDLDLLDKHLGNASSAMEKTKSNFNKLFGRIENIEALGDVDLDQRPINIEPKSID